MSTKMYLISEYELGALEMARIRIDNIISGGEDAAGLKSLLKNIVGECKGRSSEPDEIKMALMEGDLRTALMEGWMKREFFGGSDGNGTIDSCHFCGEDADVDITRSFPNDYKCNHKENCLMVKYRESLKLNDPTKTI